VQREKFEKGLPFVRCASLPTPQDQFMVGNPGRWFSIIFRAIYKNDPDKSGYYGNDPDNFFMTKMTSAFFCASLLARQNGIRLEFLLLIPF
jgi:hypothetical protein